MKSVTIPDSVTSIGNDVFYDCDALKSVTIPDSVTNVGSSAFYDCDALTNVTIGNGVTSIGGKAFYDCNALSSITIPDSVTSINYSAFERCGALKNVVIPNSVTSIGSGAFNGCNTLTSVTIPDSVTSVGDRAFYGCTALESVYYTGTEAQWNAISFGGGVWYNTPSSRVVYYNSTGPTTSTESNTSQTPSNSSSSTTTNPFKDVASSEYYATPVIWAVNKGITTGTTDTTFSPNDGCTRAQIVTFLWRSAGSPNPSSSSNPFKDVSSSQYYYKAVLWAVEQGITTSTTNTTFSPDATCKRSEAVTFLWRANGKKSASASNPFKDVPSGQWYTSAVLWAVANNITTGTSKTTFSPSNTCTRAQIVTFLYRAAN